MTLLDDYQRCTQRLPCPICENKKYCLVARDGTTAICTKLESSERLEKANGWRHTLREDHRQLALTKPGAKSPKQPKPQHVHATLDAAVRTCGPKGFTQTKTWTYADRACRPVLAVARFDAPGEKKELRQFSRSGDGWVCSALPGPRPLYRLQELLAEPRATVFLFEGEKSADIAVDLGLVATTTSQGAQCPDKSDLAPLAGRQVVILPDHDEVGEKYAAALVELLTALEPPAAVRVLRLPDLVESGDDIEQFVQSREAEGKEVDAIRSEIVSLAERAPRQPELPLIDAAAWIRVPMPLREPVVDRLLRRGEVANLVGASKSQKSWTALDLAIGAAAGLRWLGTLPVDQCRVLHIDGELHPETISHRLHAVANSMGVRLEPGQLEVWPLRGKSVDADRLCRDLRSCGRGRWDLVIFDPMYKLYGEGFDESSNADMARLYATFDAVADRLDAALMIVHHTSKGSQSERSTVDVGAGAGAQARAVDCHLALRPHESDGAVVLDAAVRNFEPLEPMAFRWNFPRWQPAPDLDPTALRTSNRRNTSGGSSKGRTGGAAWNTEQFVQEFIPGPAVRAAVEQKARDAGLAVKRIAALIGDAETKGLLTRKGGNRGGPSMLVPVMSNCGKVE